MLNLSDYLHMTLHITNQCANVTAAQNLQPNVISFRHILLICYHSGNYWRLQFWIHTSWIRFTSDNQCLL